MIKILVVGRESGVCDAIRTTFTYIGFSVLTAEDAESALRMAGEERPRIIFVDRAMPDGDGIDLIRRIKAGDLGAVVIMITAESEEAARSSSALAGADEWIRKPFSRNYLRDVVVEKIGALLNQGGRGEMPVILIVDDDAAFRSTVQEFISPRYECVLNQASDGETALVSARDCPPDVILLDIKMPGLGGMEVIREMRRISPLSRIVVISAWTSAEVVSQAVAMGAADYLEKPVSLAALNEKLKAVLISIGKYKAPRAGRG